MGDLLPSAWKIWHPIVFGFLAGLGFQAVEPAISFVLGLLDK